MWYVSVSVWSTLSLPIELEPVLLLKMLSGKYIHITPSICECCFVCVDVSACVKVSVCQCVRVDVHVCVSMCVCLSECMMRYICVRHLCECIC